MNVLSKFAAWWHHVWFAPSDPRPLGLLRWLNGLMLLYTHAVWTLALPEFVTDEGWMPREVLALYQPDSFAVSFWSWIPAEHLWTAHWGSLGVLAAYTVGLLTWLTAPAAAVIAISYAQRTLLANFGLDQVNALLVTALAVGPCGAYGLDELWFGAGRTLQARATLSRRLIQVHMCVMYLFAGMAKLQGPAWWNGSATWLAVSNLEYQSGDATGIAALPWLGQLLTHVTIFWELSFPFLVWRAGCRPWWLAMGAMMHLGIGAFLGMWTFGLAMISTYVAFLAEDWWPKTVTEPVAIMSLGPKAAATVRDMPSAVANPMVTAARPAPVLHAEGQPRVEPDGALVLCVSGPTALRDTLPDNLRRHGVEVITAGHITQARPQLAEHPCAAVIWDAAYTAPESVLRFCEFLFQQYPLVPLVLILESQQLVRMPESPERGLCRVVLLPCSVRDVRSALQALLEERRTRLNRRSGESQR